MVTRKSFISIILTVFLLSCLFTMTVPILSQKPGEPNPWADINDDTTVDIYDAILLANAYGATIELNKTALLLEANATYASLMSRMDNLNASFIDLMASVQGMNATNLMPLINSLNAQILQLQSNITALNATVTELQTSNASLWTSLAQLKSEVDNINVTLSIRISTLEGQVATMSTTIAAMNATITQLSSSNAILNASVLECMSLIAEMNATFVSRMNVLETELTSLNATVASKLGAPDFDSGWVWINKGQSIILNHNLGTTDVMVYMMGYDNDSTHYTHQIGFGGDNYFGGAGGAYWYELTSTTIKTTRAADDNDWHMIRALIWKVYR